LQASLFGYVEVDHPLVSPAKQRSMKRKTAEVDARVGELRRELRALEQPYRDRLLPAKYAKFPQNVQDAIAVPEAQRTPGQSLLAGQVIRGVTVSPDEIDRVMKPEDLKEKRRLNENIAQVERTRPKPIPVAAGITDGGLPVHAGWPRRRAAPGKGVKREAIEGTFLFRGPGRYQTPPSYFLIRGDVNSKGPPMQPGFIEAITSGNPPVELPPASGQTSGRRRALAEWLVSPDNH